jgi:uncharacterized protein with ParB-like and HNH nuclease domain
MNNRVYYGEYSLRHWIELILKKNLILPDYQRLFVWSEAKVETLIDTLKKNQFVPPVTIGAYKNEDSTQNLILDGQQRLTTILLAFLGIFPDKLTYQRAVEHFLNDNDDEQEENEELDNVLEWTFRTLLEKGNSKEQILGKIIDSNYKRIDLAIDDTFLDKTFLGFSYLVPNISNIEEQQRYYSSVFRNINIQGQILLAQESRESLYYLDQELVQFFNPDFIKSIVVKSVSSEIKVDFVRYLSLLSQYKKDGSSNSVARSYKQYMEEYYEEYIHLVVNDEDGKYGKFSNYFADKRFEDRFLRLKSSIGSLEIYNQFPSIIDLDVYFFGLIYEIVLEDKSIDDSRKAAMRDEIELKISEFKSDPSHTKAPSNLTHLRARITSSIEIYRKYAS